MVSRQQTLIDIAKRHFTEVVMPKLRIVSKEALDNMLVFIEGSVAYGFCDERSDVDLDYYIDLDLGDDVSGRVRDVFTAETYWHESARVSYGFGGDYWKFGLLAKNDMERFWNEFNPYAVNNIARAIPVWDPKKLLPPMREKIAFYPEYMRKKVIRGLWVTMNDSGEYNFNESTGRNNHVEGKIYLFRAIEAMLRMAYVLNGHYYPPTKWLTAGLGGLERDFGLKAVLAEIIESPDPEMNYASYMKSFNRIKEYMLENASIESECIEKYGSVFMKPFHIFSTF